MKFARAHAVNSREVARAFLDLFVESWGEEEEEEGLVSRGESYESDPRSADQVQQVLPNAVSGQSDRRDSEMSSQIVKEPLEAIGHF